MNKPELPAEFMPVRCPLADRSPIGFWIRQGLETALGSFPHISRANSNRVSSLRLWRYFFHPAGTTRAKYEKRKGYSRTDIVHFGVITVSTNEDYSNWIQYMSNVIHALSLFSGFTFTSITILLSLLPDPSQISSQVTLFLLSTLLDFFLFLMGWQTILLVYHCKNIPPLTKGLRLTSRLWFSSFALLCMAVTTMFLLWNLTYLALASGIALGLIVAIFYRFAWKPYMKFRTTQST
jgi:hypothetical protein